MNVRNQNNDLGGSSSLMINKESYKWVFREDKNKLFVRHLISIVVMVLVIMVFYIRGLSLVITVICICLYIGVDLYLYRRNKSRIYYVKLDDLYLKYYDSSRRNKIGIYKFLDIRSISPYFGGIILNLKQGPVRRINIETRTLMDERIFKELLLEKWHEKKVKK